jgi:hypothetical protein
MMMMLPSLQMGRTMSTGTIKLWKKQQSTFIVCKGDAPSQPPPTARRRRRRRKREDKKVNNQPLKLARGEMT